MYIQDALIWNILIKLSTGSSVITTAKGHNKLPALRNYWSSALRYAKVADAMPQDTIKYLHSFLIL